ncbi:MAG: Maf family protein [Vulcanimicrobiaceae bacterium]
MLASASPRRLELLCSLGIRVRVVPSEIDEGDRPGHAPRELAVVLAAEKAAAVAPGVPDALVVAADTVVELDGRSLGKPRDPEEARAMLVALGGREHLVHSAYALRDGPSRRRLDGVATTRVRFAPLESAALDAYVASGDPFDKAGGYGIQGRGAALVERIDGDFYTVMGFPLGEFIRRLPALGYVLPETPR